MPNSAAALRLSLFGGIDLRGSPAAERVLVQPKTVGLLAYLAVEGGGARGRRFQRRDLLAALLWPELDQAHARAALRKAVFHVRDVLGAQLLLSRGDEELALDHDALWCDAVAFGDAIERGELLAALELYRGDLMPGFHLPECDAFGRWLDDRRGELRGEAAAASWALAQRFEAGQQLTDAGRWARQAVRYSRDDERVLRRAMTMLHRVGDRAGALRLYEEFARRLRTELEAEPSAETQSLVSEMRRG
ncbi:MAG TPA: BTAD domain-containing putative transcriptional regulator [Gemmatimonadaceae bacterium]|nr:BTAD domain-containing putative transcriptional regulator [Gemmatimonadaceae bacterium]